MAQDLTIILSFKDELSDFLAAYQRGHALTVKPGRRRSVKDLIESHGVPHSEVDKILVNERAVDGGYLVKAGDHIEVWPFRDPPDSASLLPRAKLRKAKFIVDDNVARLAKPLRMLGFDTAQEKGMADAMIVQKAKREERIILTRDRDLLKRRDVELGFYVRSTEPYQQAKEIVRRLYLQDCCQPLSRCLTCNTQLRPMSEQEQSEYPGLPADFRLEEQQLYTCDSCLRAFWEGSHFEDMRRRIERLLAPA